MWFRKSKCFRPVWDDHKKETVLVRGDTIIDCCQKLEKYCAETKSPIRAKDRFFFTEEDENTVYKEI